MIEFPHRRFAGGCAPHIYDSARVLGQTLGGACHVWTYMDPADCNRFSDLRFKIATADLCPRQVCDTLSEAADWFASPPLYE